MLTPTSYYTPTSKRARALQCDSNPKFLTQHPCFVLEQISNKYGYQHMFLSERRSCLTKSDVLHKDPPSLGPHILLLLVLALYMERWRGIRMWGRRARWQLTANQVIPTISLLLSSRRITPSGKSARQYRPYR